jgi:hypothetical protein
MAVAQKRDHLPNRIAPGKRSDGAMQVMELCRSLNKTLEDTVNVGNSPIVFDYLGDVGFQAIKGWIICDGEAGGDPDASIQVEFSRDGVTYGDPWTMFPGEQTLLSGLEVASIRVTRIAFDVDFRIWLA